LSGAVVTPDWRDGRSDRAAPDRLAAALLGNLESRFAHSTRVGYQARRVVGLVRESQRDVLLSAAWLHDIGYAEAIANTGCHSVDGGRWLRTRGWPDEVCQLVAWHTSSSQEAELRGLEAELRAEFAPPEPLSADALSWADLTSSPSGDECDAESRLAKILERYPPESIEHRATVAALPDLRRAVANIETRLAGG
jgi:hypothetical protein